MDFTGSLGGRLFWNEDERKNILEEIKHLPEGNELDEAWRKIFKLFDEWVDIVSCQAEEFENTEL